jgi:hypothetical protein
MMTIITCSGEQDSTLHTNTPVKQLSKHLKPAVMKKYLFAIAMLTSGFLATAQNTEDALRISQDRPSGTARSMALGGAMGSLGGDFSSIGINPAGIAVYRSSEFTFTPSLHLTNTKANYYNLTSNDEKITLPFQQIGFVGTYAPIREASTGLISTHFAIGYTRNNSFANRTYIQGNGVESSLLDMFVSDANANVMSPFYNSLAYEHYLIDDHPFDSNLGYIHGFEYVGEDEREVIWGPSSGLNQSRIISERGNSGEFNLSFGANFNHKFYLGASMGIATFNYKSDLSHFEKINGGWQNYAYDYLYFRALDEIEGRDDFLFQEKISVIGTGMNLKVGIIFKPVNSLRIGASFHTPTFYSFDEEYSTSVRSEYFDIELDENDNPTVYDGGVDSGKNYGEFTYNFRTPLKAVGSISYIIGKMGLVSLDYEYTDYSTMQYKSKYSDIDDLNAVNSINNQIAKLIC